MKLLPLVLLVSMVIAGTGVSSEELVVPAKPEATADFLKRMRPVVERDVAAAKIKPELSKIMVSLKFRETPLSAALEKLNDSIRAHNAGTDVVMVPLIRIKPEYLRGAKPDVDEKIPISLTLANINLEVAVDYVTKLGGLTMEIEPDGLWLKPDSPEEAVLVHCAYLIPPSVCSTKEQVGKWINKDLPAYGGTGSWDFDKKSHVLAMQCSDIYMREFEKWYAGELIRRGFKATGEK